MSDVFRRIADIHRAKVAKAEESRAAKEARKNRAAELFRTSGIPDMWADVKDTHVRNFALGAVVGFNPRLSDFVVPDAPVNINGNGLALYSGSDNLILWHVYVASADDVDPHYTSPKGTYSASNNGLERMAQDFVQWLSKRITAQMLLDMDIDLSPVEPQKQARRIQKLEEAV